MNTRFGSLALTERRPVRRRRQIGRLLVIAGTSIAFAALAACGGGSAKQTASSEVLPVKQGGQIVIGAEAEPDCTDWMATCAGSIWGTYIMQEETMPTVFNVRKVDGKWVPKASPLMASEPTTSLADGKQSITYKLNPKAIWSDGEPITSADLKYTALQVRDAKDIFDRTGYNKITSIDTPDPTTAVIHLNSAYAGWKTLFSAYGIYPSHLMAGKDRATVMKDGYSFSGGPWKIEAWKKGVSVTLVPNDKYWGAKPKLDKVVFDFLPDTSAAFQALRSGQVDALFPSAQLDALSQIKAGVPDTRSEIEPKSGNLEAIWMNNATFPFDSKAVRQALAYSIDRSAIVKRLFSSLDLKDPAQSFVTPIVGAFGGTDFSKYTLKPAEAEKLMAGDGWTKNGDGVWAKDGKTASFTILTLSGNKRRDLTLQMIQSQLAKAGFSMKIKPVTPADLFGKILPDGDFQAALYTLIDTFPDPTLSTSFDSANIPSAKNGQSGINMIRAKVPGLDTLLRSVDTELDTTKRIAISKQADKLIADYVPSLPLQILPSVLLWNTKVGGPLSINPTEGAFWNLAEWGIAKK